MIALTISNKKLNLIESCDELTLGQFLKLRNGNLDTIGKLSLLCNVDPKEIEDVKYSEKVSKQFAHAVALTEILNRDMEDFFKSDRKFYTPKEVKVLDKTIKIPKDLEKEPFWPSRKVKEILQEVVKATGKGHDFDPTDRMAEVIAHYLYVPFTQMKYNEYRADEFKEAIYDLPLTVAVPLSNFFFLKWKRLYLTRTGSFLTSLLHLKKRLVFKFSRITEK